MTAAAASDPRPNLRVDADRLWSSLMELAKIGGTEKGGVCRIVVVIGDAAENGRKLRVVDRADEADAVRVVGRHDDQRRRRC